MVNKKVFLIITIAIIIIGVFLFIYSQQKEKIYTDNNQDTEIVGENENNLYQNEINEKGTNDNPIYDPRQFSWSTMQGGPYKDKISYATSTDLITWKDSGKILAEHASVPDALIKESVIYVYFVDVSIDNYPEKIGVIISNDNGKTWGTKQFANIKGLGQKAAVDPTPVLLDDGRIRLYYLDLNEVRMQQEDNIKNKIYSAISDDGINFVEEGIGFEYPGIYDPSVIRVSNDLWRMYVGNQDGQEVYSATSSDGLNFQYEGVAYTGGAIPDVIFENEKYYLYIGGIEILTSNDGKKFTNTGKRFDLGKITADPGVIKLGDKNYLMVYKTKDMI